MLKIVMQRSISEIRSVVKPTTIWLYFINNNGYQLMKCNKMKRKYTSDKIGGKDLRNSKPTLSYSALEEI